MDSDVGTFGALDEAPAVIEHRYRLPTRLRLLCVGRQQPSWVNLTLQFDAEGCHEPQFLWVSTGREALGVLSDQSFDCVLVSSFSSAATFPEMADSDETIDAVSLVKSIRAGGYDDPLILIASKLDEFCWAEVCRENCDILITANRWECSALVPVIQRAIERVELMHENHRLAVGNHRRLVRERDEAEHLLAQQRQILGELERLAGMNAEESRVRSASGLDVDTVGPASDAESGPTWQRFSQEVAGYYHELLRTYVIMGSGTLGPEIAKVAELMSLAGLKPHEGMQVHLERVEALVRGLGNRSARHVMARADLMALELMMHLGECYQRRGLQ